MIFSGSSNARLKIGTLGNGRRTPPKQTLMDFLPPPPLEAPPPESSQDIESPPKSAVSVFIVTYEFVCFSLQVLSKFFFF